jgi:hypothetical protein
MRTAKKKEYEVPEVLTMALTMSLANQVELCKLLKAEVDKEAKCRYETGQQAHNLAQSLNNTATVK